MTRKVSEHVRESTCVSTGAVVVNVIFNAVFIFGAFGLPPMGVRGAALATVLARIAELVWCVILSYRPSYIRLRLRDVVTIYRRLSLDFLRYTLPILGAMLLWGIGFTAYTALMGHLGKDAAAANAIAAVARDLMCCVCNGLAGGCGIMIGNELGAGRLRRGKIYGERSMVLSFATGGLSTLVILGCIPLVSSFIPLTEQAHRYMTGMFMILSVYMIGRCVCTVVINGIFSAGGRHALRRLQLERVHVGDRAPVRVSGGVRLGVSRSRGVRVHVPRRSRQDPVGDAPLPALQVGQEHHPVKRTIFP